MSIDRTNAESSAIALAGRAISTTAAAHRVRRLARRSMAQLGRGQILNLRLGIGMTCSGTDETTESKVECYPGSPMGAIFFFAAARAGGVLGPDASRPAGDLAAAEL
jgi:hypothetical protein